MEEINQAGKEIVAHLAEMLEGTKPVELTDDEIREYAEHDHPGVRGMILCLVREKKLDLPEELLLERLRVETDEVNKIELQSIVQSVQGQVQNVHFPNF
jgi:hypothetical protein